MRVRIVIEYNIEAKNSDLEAILTRERDIWRRGESYCAAANRGRVTWHLGVSGEIGPVWVTFEGA